MNNKSMSDYIKAVEDLVKDNPKKDEPSTKTIEYMFIELIEALQQSTKKNLELITGNSQVIGMILDVLENHSHCKQCNKMIIEGTRCSCNV